MPMYEYECISCSIRFEVQRSIHDVNIPKCCGFDMRRIYDPVGAIFMGTGWGKDAKQLSTGVIHSRQKPTDLWGSVSNWVERQPCKPGMSCHVSAPRGSTTGSQGLKTVERSMIPYELSKEILEAIDADV